jgi:hypothetical protein
MTDAMYYDIYWWLTRLGAFALFAGGLALLALAFCQTGDFLVRRAAERRKKNQPMKKETHQ